MFPKKTTYDYLKLFPLIGVSNKKYHHQLIEYFKQKKNFYQLAVSFIIPTVLVLATFFYFYFNLSILNGILVTFGLIFLSFFIISVPIYYAASRPIIRKEQQLANEIDTHLTELANQGFFSKDAKARRLLNQEFQIVKLGPVRHQDIHLILNNEKLSFCEFSFLNRLTKQVIKKKTIFYEKQPLKPIILVTLYLLDETKHFEQQVTFPIEFELVNGLVSEQIVFLDKEDYIVNPKIFIDSYHFRKLYQLK